VVFGPKITYLAGVWTWLILVRFPRVHILDKRSHILQDYGLPNTRMAWDFIRQEGIINHPNSGPQTSGSKITQHIYYSITDHTEMVQFNHNNW
jgi:hypothetical protein